jgi:hypothetical protein
MLAGIGCVIVDAEGASVDLRGPHHDKFLQQRFQTIVLNRLSEVDPRLHCGGTGGEGVQSWRHPHLLSGVFGEMTSWTCRIRHGSEIFFESAPYQPVTRGHVPEQSQDKESGIERR